LDSFRQDFYVAVVIDVTAS